jgi:hypothetical protein
LRRAIVTPFKAEAASVASGNGSGKKQPLVGREGAT